MSNPIPTEAEAEALDLIWGMAPIARFIKVPPRKAYHLAESGYLTPAVRKVGGSYVGSRRLLRHMFLGEAA